MSALVDALRQAVRAEIAAAVAAAGPSRDARRLNSEHMEAERSWAYVARVAQEARREHGEV